MIRELRINLADSMIDQNQASKIVIAVKMAPLEGIMSISHNPNMVNTRIVEQMMIIIMI